MTHPANPLHPPSFERIAHPSLATAQSIIYALLEEIKIGSSGDEHIGQYCCTHLVCWAPSFLLCCVIEDRVCTSTIPCLLLTSRLRPGNGEGKLKVSWAVHVEGQSHQEISVNRLCGLVSESSTPARFFEIFHTWRIYCLISNLLIWFYFMVHGAFDLAEWYKYSGSTIQIYYS